MSLASAKCMSVSVYFFKKYDDMRHKMKVHIKTGDQPPRIGL